MKNSGDITYPFWAYRAIGGAVAATGLAFAYTGVFIVYAVIRSSLLVIRVNPDAGAPGTIVAYAATLTIAALVICALMAVPAALIGLLTAALLKRLVHGLNPQHKPSRAVMICALTCFAIVVALHVVCQQALGFTIADVVANPETYLFWLAFPSLIYIGAGGVAGNLLNRSQARPVVTYPVAAGVRATSA